MSKIDQMIHEVSEERKTETQAKSNQIQLIASVLIESIKQDDYSSLQQLLGCITGTVISLEDVLKVMIEKGN